MLGLVLGRSRFVIGPRGFVVYAVDRIIGGAQDGDASMPRCNEFIAHAFGSVVYML